MNEKRVVIEKHEIEDKFKDPLRYLLPDLIGKPSGMTDNDGMIKESFTCPPDCYIFFYPIPVWDELSKGGE